MSLLQRNINALLVEDDPWQAKYVRIQLRKRTRGQFQVTAVETLAEAVDRLVSSCFDVVLLDLNLPDSTGLATLYRILEVTTEPAIIVLTADDDEDTAIGAVDAGAQDFLPKQATDYSSLVRAIRHAVQRRSMLRRLDASQSQYRLLAESASDLIARLSYDGVYRYVAPSCRKLLGYAPAKMLGRRDEDFCHPDDVSSLRRFRDEIAQSGNESTVSMRLRHADGRYVWFETRCQPSSCPRCRPNCPNNDCALQMAARDITDRKEAEAALMVSQRRRQHSERLEAVGQLAGGMAHEFNNLMHMIMGYGEMIARELEDRSRAHKDITSLLSAAERGALLTRQLLTFSREHDASFSMLDLNKFINEMRAIVDASLGRESDLELQLDESLPEIQADAAMVQQILVNLCMNACDAMSEGGTITICTRHEHEGDPLDAEVSGPHALLIVSDPGCGMTREVLDRIFDPFFSTKGPDEGTGLGLSAVYGIVQKHNGSIRCESVPGQGTTFQIRLPIIHAVQCQVGGEAPEESAGAKQQEMAEFVEELLA